MRAVIGIGPTKEKSRRWQELAQPQGKQVGRARDIPKRIQGAVGRLVHRVRGLNIPLANETNPFEDIPMSHTVRKAVGWCT